MEFFLGQLSDEVALRMTRIGSNVKGKQIVLKVMIRAANAPAGIRTTLKHFCFQNLPFLSSEI